MGLSAGVRGPSFCANAPTFLSLKAAVSLVSAQRLPCSSIRAPFFTSLHPVRRAAEVNRPSFTSQRSLESTVQPKMDRALSQLQFLFLLSPPLHLQHPVNSISSNVLQACCARIKWMMASRLCPGVFSTAQGTQHVSGLCYSLKENSTFDRKNRLHCSCFFDAKICTREHAAARGECLQARLRLEQSDLTHTQAHSFGPMLPLGARGTDCPLLTSVLRCLTRFVRAPLFSIANSWHIIWLSAAASVDVQLGLVLLQRGRRSPPPLKNKPKLHNAFFSLSTTTPAISDCWKEGILRQNRPFFHHPRPPPELPCLSAGLSGIHNKRQPGQR